jgi:tetratricopeptide (TPR) repeat protein
MQQTPEEFIAAQVAIEERREQLGLRYDTASWAPLSDACGSEKWICKGCKIENVALQEECVICGAKKGAEQHWKSLSFPSSSEGAGEAKKRSVCAICIDSRSNDNIETLSCGHDFHKSCIGALRTHGVKSVCEGCRMIPLSGAEIHHDKAARLLVRAQRTSDEEVNKLALFEEAGELLRRVCDESPAHPMAHGNLGYVLSEKGDLEGARDSYQNALKINPRDAWTHCSLGTVFQDLGDYSAAKASMLQAIKIKVGGVQVQ